MKMIAKMKSFNVRDVKISFAARFSQLRAEQKFTQQEIAVSMQLGQTTVSKWEHGESEPTFLQLAQIASIFNVSTDYLLGISDKR